MQKIKYIGGSLVILLVVWQMIASIGGWNEALFPSPWGTLVGLGELVVSGVLLADIGASLGRFALGYISAVVLAMALGLVLGWYKGIWNYLNPVAQVLRPVSPVAWLPFIVLFFGIGEMPALVIIFIAAFFPVLLATVAAVQGMEEVYLKVARNFGIGQPQILTKIVFPAVFPRIATGLHLALGTAWVFLVAGEMAGAQSGLGFLIIDARNNLRADWLMAAILTIGVLGLALDGMVSYLESHIYRRWGLARRNV